MMNVFKIRVVYKSGYVHDFECTEVKVKGSNYSWTAFDPVNNNAILLGVDNIESIWQLGVEQFPDNDEKE